MVQTSTKTDPWSIRPCNHREKSPAGDLAGWTWDQLTTVQRSGRREGRLRTAGRKKGIIMENKTIQVTVQGGVVVDVKNLPEGWDLQIIDKDNEEN